MKTKLALAITSALALTACVDDYELESEGSNFHSVGTVEVTGDTTTGETLTATITDNDGFSADAVTYTWYKDNAPNTNTGSTYVLTDEDIDSVLSVKVEYVDDAGYSEVAISEFTEVVEIIAIQSPSTVAIEGDFYVDYDVKAVITDENGFGDNAITYTWMADGVEISDADETSNTYTLTADEEGKTITVLVTYVDNKNFDEEALSEPTSEVIAVPDGYEENQVAKLVDESADDSGVLRVKLQEVDDNTDPTEIIVAGKVSVSFSKDVVMAGETAKEAYIGLMGASTSTYAAMFDLRIGNGTYTIRTPKTTEFPDGQMPMDVETTFTPGDWIDVDITWDASAATDSVGPIITCYIEGVEVWSGNSPSDSLSSVIGGVQVVNFKVSDGDSILTEGDFKVDDLAIYKDMAGTEVLFEDDFSTYELGLDLNKNNNDGVAPYNGSTVQATVSKVLKLAEE